MSAQRIQCSTTAERVRTAVMGGSSIDPASPRDRATGRPSPVVWIWSMGETPRCGTGKRRAIADIGKRWVRVRPAANPQKHPDRISRATFEAILVGGAA